MKKAIVILSLALFTGSFALTAIAGDGCEKEKTEKTEKAEKTEKKDCEKKKETTEKKAEEKK